jgi:hypothetical protein
MIYLIINFALFFLVLYFVIPVTVVFAVSVRDPVFHKIKHTGSHTVQAGTSAGN